MPAPITASPEFEVVDQQGTFHGRLVGAFTADDSVGRVHTMLTFEVTGVGFGYSDIIDCGDRWSIAPVGIKSLTAMGR